jgi:hypothetical protein
VGKSEHAPIGDPSDATRSQSPPLREVIGTPLIRSQKQFSQLN